MSNVKRDETNGITLLPCPFCGGEAETHETIDEWIAACSSEQSELDGFTHKAQAYGTTKAEAIAAWNTRAERTCKLTYKRGAMYDVARYSCCGYEYPESISEESVAENYCPNCGARRVNE